MKQVNLKLHKNQAIILNRDTIYIEPEEDVEFIITNELKPSDELYYSLQVGEPKKIEGCSFILNEQDLKDEIKITWKSGRKALPDYFVLDLKMKNIKIIGDLLDEKYPEVIQNLQKQINELKRLNILLHERIERLEKKGVII